MKSPIHILRGSLAVVAMLALLSGCAGMNAAHYASYESARAPVRVTPITKDWITRNNASIPPTVAEPLVVSRAAKDYRYVIRPADILLVSVPSLVSFNTAGAPSLLGTQQAEGYVVYDDGSIYLPFSGWVTVGGLNLREAQERIVSSLSKFLRNPQVLVTVKEFRSQRVMVAGQVQRPGYQPITDVALTLVGALSQAGAINDFRGRKDPRPVGAQSSAMPTELPDLKRVLLKRGGQDYVVDVSRILARGGLADDVTLMGGDVVVISPLQRANVFVMGEVVRPALLEVDPSDVNLAQVLMASGGLNPLTAKASSIYVIRGDYTRPDVYQIDARSPDSMLLAQQFSLKSQDVIYVAETNVSRWNKVLQQVLPTVQGLLSTAVIANTVDDLQN